MNTINIHIRDAKVTDMDAVLALIHELAVYENAADEVAISVDNLIADGFGDHPMFRSVVATVNDTVVGFALFYNRYSTWKGSCLYLEDFIVTETWRRKGVGKLLFDRVYKIAEQEKVKRFEWQVLDWNEPAINFYKKYQTNFDDTWINCRLVFSS